MENKKNPQGMARMEALVSLLNKASKAYYVDADEMMSNYEYDTLYDELVALEASLGTYLPESPTRNVGYETVSNLPKERHASPMLSLDKTKSVEDLEAFCGSQPVLVSWKLDGLTVVLTYRDGRLYKAVTRGNGTVGEVVTNNAKVFKNLPLAIPYKGEVVIRGEAIIGYRDFEKINEEIPETEAKYKNPRNLCSGSVRQLSNEVTAKRSVHFLAFALPSAGDVDFHNSREQQFQWLKSQGFEVVEHVRADRKSIAGEVMKFSERIKENDFPSDGLVVLYDDIEYGQSLGRTAKFPRDAMAFKWADEIKETKLLEIEWSPSRTGLINPVAIFEPVELEGTTVSRASVHNLSVLEELKLGIGDEITVYKANMIIPQIGENITQSGNLEIPKTCPVCNGPTQIRQISEAQSLYCANPDCQAKHVGNFVHLVSRDALNVEGLSEATLTKFITHGFIKEYRDIFRLARYQEEIETLEGFGKKSYENLVASAEKARKVEPANLIYGLGIENVGLANAKVICQAFANDINRVIQATPEELVSINTIGEVIASTFTSYFADEKHLQEFKDLQRELEVVKPEASGNPLIFANLNFVITGEVTHFKNRGEVKALIESYGGKVTGSVTSKTSYLINNNVNSTSSKNKKAKDLNVPIITEEAFLDLVAEKQGK
ncbi:DNA ligase (NAD+) [Lachnospiraceae bacterium PF1-21]|uniref:DNA ligase n=1 Tax=Ohessyouella blattaphilus TaxID=2949333 RepID=A0ABT1EDN7_9FIRM|nr:NAD-dependent DNA ligase LigA [Ohessyouella blattaphilus]MCP1108821.1 NAD-dependent DNA ligase LigA [Ohessyouella blattaphilus]MCR8562215.1 NAD-dependent DNA ligase LigA [Ohessyouella blattaphilus]